MIKSTPSPLKLATLIGFVLSCVIVLAYLWINFGGSIPLSPEGYRFEVAFPQANELATGADVRIAGVNLGQGGRPGRRLARQPDTGHDPAGQPIRPDSPRHPGPAAAKDADRRDLRPRLSPGNRRLGRLADHGRLADGQVEPDVTLDQILSTFDPTTRQAFQTWMQAQAAAGAGRGQDINAAFASLPEFVDSAESLVSVLDTQSAAVRGMVANTGTFFSAISARRGEAFGAGQGGQQPVPDHGPAKPGAGRPVQGPPRLRRAPSRLTLPALTRFGQNADPVVRALWPIASELDQTFADTGQLAPEFRGLFERLGPAVSASERGLPAFDSIVAHIPPLLQAFEPWLQNANPMVRYIGLYKHGSPASSPTRRRAPRARTCGPRGPRATRFTSCARPRPCPPRAWPSCRAHSGSPATRPTAHPAPTTSWAAASRC